ncbi:MAG TPA: undecaprenyl/decaprenyl-phosphate alpha-N-acetylglucosaminyl 1-phosphate transferase [Firmicutes bacterium]|nr:undecaprenyl/decaprenyl-phosphate alpha-N-acetylglucosaminyl 1-phosphate transferase [Bacillota bacterium]
MSLSLALAGSFILSLLLTQMFRKLAFRFKVLDKPDSDVKLHGKATPYLGGAAFISAALITLFSYHLFTSYRIPQQEFVLLMTGLLIFFTGLLDDIKKLTPLTKILIQIAAASILICMGIRLDIYFLPLWLNILLTLFWIVGVTNAFNLIDIMDGLCGGVSAIAAFFLFFSNGDYNVFLLFLTASLAGFLVHNFPPAKIFMGDAGSLSLGFLLAGYSILGSFTLSHKWALISPLLILWLPIYETILVTVLRLSKGRSPFYGSKDHYAFRLKAAGFPVPAVLLVSYFLSIIMGESALLAVSLPARDALLVYLLLILVFLLFFYLLSKIDIDSLEKK